MSAQLPSFSFPEPGPVLPPLPESTIEPLPSQDDPRLEHVGLGMDPLQWYIYSALGNKSNYPTDYYTYGESKIHVGDIIEPKFVAPESNPSGAESNAWFLRWEMMCLLCPFTTDGEKRERDSGTGYPFCDQATLTVAPARSYSESTVDSNGNEKLILKIPESNVSDVDSLTACAVEQVLQPSWISKLDAEYPRVISQIFIVSRKPRERAPWMYNEFNIWGYEEDPIEDASSSISSRTSTPTSTGYSTPSWVSSSSGSTENHKDDSLKAAARIGMITGIIVGIICFVTFLGCCMHQRKRMEKEAGQLPTVAPYRRDARYELAEVDRSRNEALAPRPPAEQDDPELPPAYYKVVTNVERMEIEQNMYRQARASTGWPPSYRDAQNASTTSAPNSPSVSPVSARGPAPYPALPSSPRR